MRCRACGRPIKLLWRYDVELWEDLCKRCLKISARAFLELIRKRHKLHMYTVEDIREDELKDIISQLVPNGPDLPDGEER